MEKKLNIYLATPVNGRREATMKEKMKAANDRIEEMKQYLRKWYPDAVFWSSFDTIPCIGNLTEAEIMGECVRKVMECDMVILDKLWYDSRGCSVERFVADQYGKVVKTMMSFTMRDKLNGDE